MPNKAFIRTLSMENGKVYSQRDEGRRLEIIPMSENNFYFEDSLIYIIIEKNK
jgi:hypothetical protein